MQGRVGLIIANDGPGTAYIYYGQPSQPINSENYSQRIPSGGEIDYSDRGLACPPDEIWAGFDDPNCMLMVTQWVIPGRVLNELARDDQQTQGRNGRRRRTGEPNECRV